MITPAVERRARQEARDYYTNNHLDHGRYDQQDAEWAAINVLKEAGLPSNDADRIGCRIAAEVARDVDEGMGFARW